MSWQDIIKDSKAANEALEMDFFMNNLKKALKYETQDIRFADFGTKQKVLDIAKKDNYHLRNEDGDYHFMTISSSDSEAAFDVSRGKITMKVVFKFEGDEVKFKIIG
tara:strand:- start:1675 stop:1995 length:321 start_codon:yes stop_codon:yes gene_type:complete